MKKALTYLLALAFVCVFIFTLSACNNVKDPSSDDEKQIWLPYTMLDHHENCKYTYYYNEYGNEIKAIKEDLSGNVQATWISEYDDNQNLIKKSVDTGNGEPFVQLIQIYDDNGNLVERRGISKTNESVYTYTYDEQNKLISKSCDGQIFETYTYEADGSYKGQNVNNAKQYSIYRPDGKIKELHLASNNKIVYSYNEDGVLVECVTYSGESMKEKTVYHLDENGNAVKVSKVNASGDETVYGEYEYKQYTVKAAE